jgi:hypothetical protein
MTIDSLPPAPEPTDTPQQFNTKAFLWVAALDTWTNQTNATAAQVQTNKNSTDTNVSLSQSAAAASASSASASAVSASQSEGFRNQASSFATSASVSAAAAQAAAGLPSLVGKNGFVLGVNDDASGVSWRPAYTFGAEETFILGM